MPSLTSLYSPSGAVSAAVNSTSTTSTFTDRRNEFSISRPSPPRPAPLQHLPSYSATVPTDITTSAPTDITAPFYPVPSDPQRPEYSPITPKVQPAIPAVVPPHQAQHDRPREQQGGFVKPASIALPPPPPPPSARSQTDQTSRPLLAVEQQSALPPTTIPRPHPQPFSSEDSTDAIALRAAISALQFQKKKAQNDVRALEAVRKKALQEPVLFKTELAAGRLYERRPTIGDLSSVLDASDSEDDDDAAHEEQAVLGADRPEAEQNQIDTVQSSSRKSAKSAKVEQPPFSNIPGPQTVVRMPPINWDKYHILSAPLDELHEKQRRWPGSSDRGREHAVAAPYSPFHDVLRDPDDLRKDSGTAVVSATGTVSEHPMETRRNQGAKRTS